MNKKKTENQLLAYLLFTIIILLIVCLAAGLALGIATLATGGNPPKEPPKKTDSTPTLNVPADIMLKEDEDAGPDYIGKMIFFGESTTAHLSSRGDLPNGASQVWKDSSGTKLLSSKLLSGTIIYPPTGESITVSEAVELEKPEYMVLSFGLNGIVDFVKNKESYVSNYGKLITAIQKASPDTKIILQSVYPVTADCDDFSENGKKISQYTATLNEWLPEIAASYENVRIADTASVLTDDTGCLDSQYDYSGDGIHLTKTAYTRILYYLRTHPWQE